MEVIKGRMYDYNNGRFLSVDPFIQDPSSTQSMNPYTYIFNNPLSGVDPTGYRSVCVLKCADGGDYTNWSNGRRQYWVGVSAFNGIDDGGGLYSASDDGDNSNIGSKIPVSISMQDLIDTIIHRKSFDEVHAGDLNKSDTEIVVAQISDCEYMICKDGSDIARSLYSGIGEIQDIALPWVNGVDVMTTPDASILLGPVASGSIKLNKVRKAVKAGENRIPLINGRKPINSSYAGKVHPSGVKFKKTGFPDFSPYTIAEVKLKGLTGKASDFTMANIAVKLKTTPSGYTWHHVEDARTMQLIPTDIHDAARHTGGAAILRNQK